MAIPSPQSPQETKDQRDGDMFTSSSASDQEDEFVVDRIIAQSVPDNSDDEEMYLVRWEGYPDHQCTWEPRESFLSSKTLEQWERDKAQKQILSQDEVNQIVRKMDAYAEAKEEKKERKRNRMRQLASSGEAKFTEASKRQQNLPSLSPPEPRGSREPVGSRSIRRHSPTTAELPSLSTTNPRAKSFQETGVEPRARRSTHRSSLKRPKGTPGAHFKTLSTQYRHQKAGRNEPPPDLGKIKLKSVTEIFAAAGDDIAHILPSGNSTLAASHHMDLPSAQPVTDRVNHLESEPETNMNAVQSLFAPVRSQHDSVSGAVPRISNTPNRPVSAALNTHGRDVHHLPNGRYWLYGEVLIHVTLHEQVVGDVRFGGLPNWFKLKMISLKIGHQILVDFQLVEMRQYVALCRGRSNDLIANAYIIPFEDSRPALTELADSLDYNNRAALWYHPEIPYVLVAYSAASNDWRFLDRGNSFPQESQIHLALRNSMPKLENLVNFQDSEGQAAAGESVDTKFGPQATQTPPDSAKKVDNPPATDETASHIAEQDVVAIVSHPRAESVALLSSLRQPLPSDPLISKDSTSPLLVGSCAESEDESSESSSESEGDFTLPFAFAVPSGDSIDAVFKTQFGISYDNLTLPSVMPTSRKDLLDPRRARFYLAFPPLFQAEMDALRALLSKHTLPNLICTSVEPQGWEGFKTILGDKGDHIGVIIFHANYTNYSGLPGLATLLKMVNVNLFNLSLQRRLPYCDLSTHIERLFPNGTAILLTESSMMQQPERTLEILRWFSEMSKTKRGTWKIVLIPNVRHWLRQRAIHAEALQACFLDMLTVISELSIGQPVNYQSLTNEESEAESLDGCNDEIGKPSLVVSPANIPAYDRCHGKDNSSTSLEKEQVLVEWFAGWAAQNAQRHRKFCAISGMVSFVNQESGRWGHIEVVDPNKYMIQNNIPFHHQSANETSNPSLK